MNTMFSPILNGSQPAFDYTIENYVIHFTVPDQQAIKDIKHIGIKITLQSNNLSVVNNTTYPDYIIYKTMDINTLTGSNQSITINKSDLLSNHWQENTYYKVQIRFGSGSLTEDYKTQFAVWKQVQVQNNGFSEWSNVMIIKAIKTPSVSLLNDKTNINNTIITDSALAIESGSTPLFEGVFNTAISEPVSEYKFDLYDDNNKLLETTNWVTHNSNKDTEYKGVTGHEYNGGDSHRFKTSLKDQYAYGVVYSIRTVNGYETSTDIYKFEAIEPLGVGLPAVILNAESNDEEGVINLYLKSKDLSFLELTGKFILSRCDENDVWEDIASFYWTLEDFTKKKKLIFTDYTIESGLKYKYAIQKINKFRLRTTRVLNQEGEVQSNFQYCYLYHNGIQLKLKYNNTVSSFKHTTQIQKQDTLGGKYPIIMRNSAAYYGEFPIGGLISLHADEANYFFNKQKDGYYYRDELVIPVDKFEIQQKRVDNKGQNIGDLAYSYNVNTTDNNLFIERKFREKVEEFLNDGKPKLYKSPTEGNMIVGITNVSMTPNQQLSRMIYSFTSTAYEVMEYNYENLINYGIVKTINTGYTEEEPFETFKIAGQLNPIDYDIEEDTNILNIITNIISSQQASTLDKDYTYKIIQVLKLSVEPFPGVNMIGLLRELEDKYHAGDIIEDEYDHLKTKYEMIDKWQKNYAPNIHIGIKLGSDLTVYTGMTQKYQLTQPGKFDIISILPSIIKSGDQTMIPPVLINYEVEATVEEKESNTIKSNVGGRFWGQLCGLFNTKAENISTVNLPEYDINNCNVQKAIEQQLVEQLKSWNNNLKYNFEYSDTEQSWLDVSNKLKLNFIGYTRLEIEADQGTHFVITSYSQNDNNKENRDIYIGPTSKYKLKQINTNDAVAINLSLNENENAVHCIIDYELIFMISDLNTDKEEGK